ncbi:Proline--tRNA ligase [Frankliniella fusca]|uniref:Proline--tRNA ligase n=1 Tax=Frankliniella fusca TaxID=407009 RepID=A0AAE1LCQ1_9NEOP|nr:Proline--tRNA ligase [Frankliniella fusca]
MALWSAQAVPNSAQPLQVLNKALKAWRHQVWESFGANMHGGMMLELHHTYHLWAYLFYWAHLLNQTADQLPGGGLLFASHQQVAFHLIGALVGDTGNNSNTNRGNSSAHILQEHSKCVRWTSGMYRVDSEKYL